MGKNKSVVTPDMHGCKYRDCIYRQRYDGSCTYYLVEGVTRTFLHKDENVDINNPCREYTPGETERFKSLHVRPNWR